MKNLIAALLIIFSTYTGYAQKQDTIVYPTWDEYLEWHEQPQEWRTNQEKIAMNLIGDYAIEALIVKDGKIDIDAGFLKSKKVPQDIISGLVVFVNEKWQKEWAPFLQELGVTAEEVIEATRSVNVSE